MFPLDLLHKVFETNFFAQVALTKTLLPLIKKSPAGRIVNLSSILGSLTLHADPNSPIYNAKSFAYDASKTALNAFTVHLAYELRDTNIKVNSAHPGWVKTDMGGDQAPMELSEGGKTSAALATLARQRPHRRLLPPRQAAALVTPAPPCGRLSHDRADSCPCIALPAKGRRARTVIPRGSSIPEPCPIAACSPDPGP